MKQIMQIAVNVENARWWWWQNCADCPASGL
jgi:hypothetical protein